MMISELPTRSEFPPVLSKVSPVASLLILLFDWSLVSISIGVAITYPGAVTFLLAQLIIGSRQHALFATMHEGTHYTICKNRAWNDRISNFLAAWPVGFSTERYRIRHWLHHRYLNSERDPDWVRKKDDPTWKFPTSQAGFWKTSLPHLCGKGVLEMIYALRGIGLEKKDLPLAIPYFSAIALAITVAGGWPAFALYWLLPYCTVLPFLHRIRNSIEHLGLPKTHPLNGTRNVYGSPLERFFFGPHNASLHLIHHYYPFIPCYRLNLARAFLLKNTAYRENAHENTSYFLPGRKSVYRDMTGRSGALPESNEIDIKQAA